MNSIPMPEGRLLTDISADIRRTLEAEDLLDDNFGMSLLIGMDPMYRTRRWPDSCRFVAVFVVPGCSEGYYIHVEIDQGEKRELVFLGKTLKGWDYAWRQAKRVAELLGVV